MLHVSGQPFACLVPVSAVLVIIVDTWAAAVAGSWCKNMSLLNDLGNFWHFCKL